MDRLDVGAVGRFSALVDREHLASTMGNPGVNVLATPVLTWLFEGAASDALFPVMSEDEISVGTEICVRHLKPTPIGMRIQATVTLKEIRGRRFYFTAEVYDEVEKVAEGHIERAIIEKARFDRTVAEKLKPVPA